MSAGSDYKARLLAVAKPLLAGLPAEVQRKLILDEKWIDQELYRAWRTADRDRADLPVAKFASHLKWRAAEYRPGGSRVV